MIRHSESAGAHYWRRRWAAMIDTLYGEGAKASAVAQDLQRGLRIRQLSVSTGRIDATVHQRNLGDCDVVVHVTPLDDAQWEAVVDLLASQAVYSAQLLSGDMPKQIDQTLARASIQLFPASADELQFGCTCHHDQPGPCPASFAVLAAIGDMLDDDPWILFRLRGRQQQALMRMLQSRRNRIAGVAGEALDTTATSLVYRSGTGGDPDAVSGLAEQLGNYWGRSREQLDMQHVIAPPLVDTALLRRLGPAPFEADSAIQNALADVYRLVTRNGLALAFASEPDPDFGADSGDADTDDGDAADVGSDFDKSDAAASSLSSDG